MNAYIEPDDHTINRYRESDSDGAASALTESLDEDTDFEFGNEPMNLTGRLENHLTIKNVQKKPSRAMLFKDADEFGMGTGLGIENLDLSKDTVNENVVFGTIDPPRRKLRAAYSMNFKNDEQATIKLRPAQSMWDLPKPAPQPQQDICHRPLTIYTERSRPKKESTSRKRMGQIKPQLPVRQQVNGMVFNPESGMWEGNEAELSAFDTIKGRKDMLLKQQDLLPSQSSTMLFDQKNLCWVPRDDIASDDDPFAGINDLSETISTASTPNLRQSIMSTSSRREMSSTADVFMVPLSVQRLWQENDLRFMRKFGRWIEGDGGCHAAASDLYKMVN